MSASRHPLTSTRRRGRQAGLDAQLDTPFSPAVLAARGRALLDGRPDLGSVP